MPLQKDKEDQWLEKKVQGNKDHIILEHLQWTMGYEVQITAANRLGYSEPTVYEFSMPPKPNIIKGKKMICFLRLKIYMTSSFSNPSGFFLNIEIIIL